MGRPSSSATRNSSRSSSRAGKNDGDDTSSRTLLFALSAAVAVVFLVVPVSIYLLLYGFPQTTNLWSSFSFSSSSGSTPRQLLPDLKTIVSTVAAAIAAAYFFFFQSGGIGVEWFQRKLQRVLSSVPKKEAALVGGGGGKHTAKDDDSVGDNAGADDPIPMPAYVPEEEESDNGHGKRDDRILTQSEMLQLARQIPSIAYRNRWKRLFCVGRDGDAYETFSNRVQGHQRTLLVVRTTSKRARRSENEPNQDSSTSTAQEDGGEVFGAFADTEWNAKSVKDGAYFGGPEACLFRVVREGGGGDDGAASGKASTDSTVKVYNWTASNRYIQLRDRSRRRIALGGGSVSRSDDKNDNPDEHLASSTSSSSFGLLLENNFLSGSTGRCATFDNDRLCSDEHFSVQDFEAYGFSIW